MIMRKNYIINELKDYHVKGRRKTLLGLDLKYFSLILFVTCSKKFITGNAELIFLET